ncbi:MULTISPECIES: DUF523 domain-containing protein [Pseudoalteromonas]|uniref:Uncharacterized protein n=1 Tax=Pseudoalteromonas luteoviolacea (strain 2ta16) TaxID=1353533 RepID=V4HW21_PSEL2|nr:MULTISPECIES: DUF523 domain-containing protein [Pseudoalteromonas]ESP93973.1 hypothetical protein PL2TA16_02594 [Pseudoalteromonas luteoviolacea 2ta16]KZN33019.1 hypothetical protein N483_26410 [Pseudoalteromonas luteoviolacea NCIMB 1944]MCG7551675.1 DUF523 domain-containing protein [Pseudoalteromonas sp. Of7M-16]
MQKVFVSACLVGNKVRYNGSSLSLDKSDKGWLELNVELSVFCPEVSAGLPIPRAPAEIVGGYGHDVLSHNASVLGDDGVDVTDAFLTGARQALSLCQQHGIKYAILAEGSPSCGSQQIYDGTFSGKKIPGAGVTAHLLMANGIKVYSQHTVAQLIREVKNEP